MVIDDLIKGRIEVANAELDDLIIARSDGTPTYNLTVVVDDWKMGVTHVIRGDDHVNNTPASNEHSCSFRCRVTKIRPRANDFR